MKKLTWFDVDRLVVKMVAKGFPKSCRYVYGVPRGGIYIAMLVASRTGLLMLEELNPKIGKRSILVVDDLIDSGKTKDEHKGYSFRALIKGDGEWIEFPWERMLLEEPDIKPHHLNKP